MMAIQTRSVSKRDEHNGIEHQVKFQFVGSRVRIGYEMWIRSKLTDFILSPLTFHFFIF